MLTTSRHRTVLPARAWRVRVVTPAATEPVTLDQVKAHLRLEGTAEDALLGDLITMARDLVERWTGRRLVTTALEGLVDARSAPWSGPLEVFARGAPPAVLEIPQPPTATVTELAAIADDDAVTVVDPSTYAVDVQDADRFARLAPRHGAAWPIGGRVMNALRLRWTAGYGNAAAVPAALRQAVLVLVAWSYEHRGTCCDCPEAAGIAGLLAPFRLLEIG